MWITFLKKIWMVRKPAISLWNKKQIVMSVLELALIFVVSYAFFKPVRTAVRLLFTPLKNK
jgi:hypothetical protein